MKNILLTLAAAVLALPSLQAQEGDTQYLKLKKEGQTLYALPVDRVKELVVSDPYSHWNAHGKSLWRELEAHAEWSTFCRMVKTAGYEFAFDMPNANRQGALALFVPNNDLLSYVTEENLKDVAAVEAQVRNYLSAAMYSYGPNQYVWDEGTPTFSGVSISSLPEGTVLWDEQIACHNGVIIPLAQDIPYPTQGYEYFADFEAGYVVDEMLANYRMDAALPEYLLHLSSHASTAGPAHEMVSEAEGHTVLVPATEALRDSLRSRLAEGLLYFPEALFERSSDISWSRYDRLRTSLIYPHLTEAYASYSDMPDSLTLTKTGHKWAKADLDLGEPLYYDGGYYYPWRSTELPDAGDFVTPEVITTEAENDMRIFQVSTGASTSVVPFACDTLSYSQWAIEANAGLRNVEVYEPRRDAATGELERHTVSGGQYLAIGAGTSSPSVIFGVPNTLATSYDVWITFLPSAVARGYGEALPSKARVTTQYSTLRSASVLAYSLMRTSDFSLDPYAVTKVKVATVDMGVAWYGFMEGYELLYSDPDNITGSDYFNSRYGVRITVQNRSSNNGEYDRNLYIDRIELVPHVEENASE